MGYPQDLLSAARSINAIDNPGEALLRRAVSTAYYAVFHLLIEDACAKWGNPRQRSRMARQFDHRRMKEASAQTARRSQTGSDLFVVSSLFVQLQERRHEADYDLAVSFSVLDASAELAAAESAFRSWERVRESEEAQDYLFSLLFRDRA